MSLLSLFKLFVLGCFINLVFFLVDLLWLNLLPSLNVSYGPVRPALMGFTILRIGIFFIWLFLQSILYLKGAGQAHHSHQWSLLIPNLFLLGLGFYGFFVEPFHLTVSRLQIPVHGLEHSVRIVQLSDIHVERITSRERTLPKLVEGLQPDMIVITGDFVNESYVNDPQTISAIRELIGELYAPLGIYGVNGNVETPKKLHEILDGTDIHLLDDQIVRVSAIDKRFVMIGLNYVEERDDALILSHLMTQVQPDDFSLLLYHKPDLAYAARDEHINLYLTGHTHGGQVRLPFYGALFTNSIYGKTFEMGRYQLDETTLYVSRGLGFTGGIAPRVRFLCPPEIVAIDLVPEP